MNQIDVFRVLRNLTKEWYLCYPKNRRTHQNIFTRKSIFLLEGSTTIWLNYQKNNLEKIERSRKKRGFPFILFQTINVIYTCYSKCKASSYTQNIMRKSVNETEEKKF